MTEEELDNIFLEIVDISEMEPTQEIEERQVPEELLQKSFNGNQNIGILNYN